MRDGAGNLRLLNIFDIPQLKEEKEAAATKVYWITAGVVGERSWMMHMSEVKIDPTKEAEKNETPTFAHQLLSTLQTISETFYSRTKL